MKIFLPLLTAAALSAAGCALVQKKPIVLVTDRAEVASYVENFNSLQNDLRVVLRYKEVPEEALRRNEGADLVLGARLNGKASPRSLEPLDGLFRSGALRREDFYAPLLASGELERRQALLPLSFYLPAVVFLTHDLRETVPNLSISIDYLKEQGGRYNQAIRGSLVRLGFSPFWQADFPYCLAELQGARFRAGSGGALGWTEKALEDSVSYLRDWTVRTNGGFEQEEAFGRKYMYQPLGRLLDEKRIQFFIAPSGQLLRILEERKEEADFRWLAAGDRIIVSEDILFLCIPRTARRKQGAKRFLEWLFQGETQKRLLEIGRRKRLESFGIAGGFSSLRAVNERELPLLYPPLLGRIPPAELLLVPEPLPEGWEQIKAQVLLPWLREAALGASSFEALGERLRSSRIGTGRR